MPPALRPPWRHDAPAAGLTILVTITNTTTTTTTTTTTITITTATPPHHHHHTQHHTQPKHTRALTRTAARSPGAVAAIRAECDPKFDEIFSEERFRNNPLARSVIGGHDQWSLGAKADVSLASVCNNLPFAAFPRCQLRVVFPSAGRPLTRPLLPTAELLAPAV